MAQRKHISTCKKAPTLKAIRHALQQTFDPIYGRRVASKGPHPAYTGGPCVMESERGKDRTVHSQPPQRSAYLCVLWMGRVTAATASRNVRPGRTNVRDRNGLQHSPSLGVFFFRALSLSLPIQNAHRSHPAAQASNPRWMR